MGSTECFRANVAYTLYGVVNGQPDTGCDKTTYINSFFTTAGVEIFTQAMVQSGLTFTADTNGNGNDAYPGGVTSECTLVQNNNNNNNGGNNGVSNGQKKYAGSTSYGVSCSGKSFAYTTFNSSSCDIAQKFAYTDMLTTFNAELTQNATCVPIYDSSYQQGQDNTALTLLQYSQECNVRDFNSECPDPYGVLVAAARKQDRLAAYAKNPRREELKRVFTWILLALGIFLLLAAALVYRRRARLSRVYAERHARYQRKRWGIFSHKSRKGNKQADADPETVEEAPIQESRKLPKAKKSSKREGRSSRSKATEQSVRTKSSTRSSRGGGIFNIKKTFSKDRGNKGDQS